MNAQQIQDLDSAARATVLQARSQLMRMKYLLDAAGESAPKATVDAQRRLASAVNAFAKELGVNAVTTLANKTKNTDAKDSQDSPEA